MLDLKSWMPNRLLEGGVQGWVTLVELGLVSALAYSGAQLAWQVVPAPEPLPVVALRPLQATEGDPAGAAPRASLAQVARLHLFGEADNSPPPPAPVSVPEQKAPETRLNLTLRGVFASTVDEQSVALIAKGSAQEELFRIGQTVDGGAVLHKVHATYVVLLRGGREETLSLPQEREVESVANTDERGNPVRGPGSSPYSSNPATAPYNSRQGSAERFNRAPGPVSAQENSPPPIHSTDRRVAAELGSLREQMMQNPMEMTKLASVQPVMEGGEMQGYRLTPGSNRRLFFQTGLRSGDLVTQVNGIPLTNAAQLPQVMQALTKESRFEVHIIRNGTPSVLQIDVGN